MRCLMLTSPQRLAVTMTGLEQIPWHSENDPEEAILDELTDLSMRETRTDAEQARLAELFDQLEQFDHPENTLSEEEIEARLRELYERVQMPSAEDSATTAVAQKTKLKNEKSIDDTKTSSIHSRKALKLLPLVASSCSFDWYRVRAGFR